MDNRIFSLDEKDIYQLLNEVRLDQNELEQMDQEMPEILKVKMKKSLKKKIRNNSYRRMAKVGSIAVAFLLLLIIAIGTVSPALARNIPLVNSIFRILDDKFGDYEKYIPYTQLVDKSVTDSGVTLTINEALADDSTLILGYTIKSDRKIEAMDFFTPLISSVRINGSLPQGGSGTGDYLNDKTYVGTVTISYHSPSTSDNLKIDLNIDNIIGIKGQWNFSFTVSKGELKKDTRVIKTNNKVNLPESMITVDKVVLTPIDSTIYFSGNYKDKKTEDKAMDAVVYWWFVFDNQGIQLMSGGGSFGGNNPPPGKDFQGTAGFQALETIPPYITVIPCRVPVISSNDAKQPAESCQVIDGKYPLELSQGKMGKLIIKEITASQEETVVRYTAEGKAPYFQGTNLFIKNAAGEYIHPERYDIRKDEKHPNDFTMVFPALDANKQYSIGTNQFEDLNLMEDLKFKIELAK